MLTRNENDEAAIETLKAGNKHKTLSDLIYDEPTEDERSDSEINKLDTSNIKIGFSSDEPDLSSLIPIKKLCQILVKPR